MSDEREQVQKRQDLEVLPPILVSDSQGLQTLLERARQEPVVAVDTESNSLYAYHYQICLIQISLPDSDYVVDPLACDVSPLGELFANPEQQKVFHAAENDILGLKRDFGFQFANLFDTMLAARILGWPRAGLAAILAERFGVQLDKRLQRADWGRRPLRPDELAYAQLDTHYLLPLREQQVVALQTLGRWQEAQERFEQLTRLKWVAKSFDENGFWRINGAQRLSDRELAVLRELFLFREQQAQQENRPPFKVLSNKALITLSQRQPTNQRALWRLPGLTRTQIRRYGRGIVVAVTRGQQAPSPERPAARSPNHQDRPSPLILARYNALRQWRRQVARQRGVEVDVILNNDVLMAIARHGPNSLDELTTLELLGPWQLQEYGEVILRVLASTPSLEKEE